MPDKHDDAEQDEDDNEDSRPTLEYVSNVNLKMNAETAKLEFPTGKVAIAKLETFVGGSSAPLNDTMG